MHNLLNFLVKNSHWFLFILLEAVCFYFIFTANSYQKSVFLNSSNGLVGRVYAISGGITSYFGLQTENDALLGKVGELQNRVDLLENHIFEIEKDSLKTRAYLASSDLSDEENEYIVARVINNSVAQVQNYITINKGSKDGVEIGMGVVSYQGIVGEVRAVSENFAVIQSLLNPNSMISCKLTSSNTFGPLVWDGENPRYASMLEYPSHEKVAIGDTLITSGFSEIFPMGLLVGTVSHMQTNEDMKQYRLTIQLSTDFNSLKNILVVKRKHLEEKRELEKRIRNVK